MRIKKNARVADTIADPDLRIVGKTLCLLFALFAMRGIASLVRNGKQRFAIGFISIKAPSLLARKKRCQHPCLRPIHRPNRKNFFTAKKGEKNEIEYTQAIALLGL